MGVGTLIATIIGKAARRDPTTFISAFSMWAMMCGLSLMLPETVFGKVQSYDAMNTIYPHEFAWGLVMFFDGVLLQVSVLARKVPFRASVAAFSAVLWMMLGSMMLFSAWAYSYFSVVGGFSVWGAVGCFMAIEQWIHNPED